MTAAANPSTPPAAGPAAPAAPAPNQTAAAISAARQRLTEGKSLLDIPGEATTPAAPAAGAEKTGPADLTVTLPGLEERGEQPLELEAPDQETYERLNRLQNEATIGREVKQEQRSVADLHRQRTELEDMVAVDPAGFVLSEHVPAQVRTEVALSLLMEPGVIEAVEARLRESGHEGGILDVLENPDAQRTLAAEMKANRLEMRDRLAQQHAQHRAMAANAKQVMAEINRLIPSSITGARRERVFEDAVRDIRDRAHRLGLTQIDPRDLGPLLALRLRHAGAVSRTSAPAPAPASRPARPAVPGGELPKGTEARIALAKKIGLKALVERARAGT